MTSIYSHSKEAAAEARLVRMGQPAVTAEQAKSEHDRVVAGSNGVESGVTWKQCGQSGRAYHKARVEYEDMKLQVSAINRQYCAEIDQSDIIFPKPTHSSQMDEDWGI